ncbi:MAG: tetratricopeptide repeat protein, partial [Gammaproteobacteria bacterium]|nr:tetratricopeptide repeat protein [Gammaproteobacteria bacterium]NIR53160.1 tetratricopeptide repeat protein [candidate division KSB1 bacterium]NIS28397.1 tetratricopeptide repeat protein [candidate division KSB1 bacterium]NIU29125.1 tetratricopeptide repeat protein [candidate division KSB1 bacterium]NIW23019.1 tetratricopeptide repeat protein [candidate division KSB1 bacterium]
DGEIYFRLLETVRQFSYQKLLLSNQAERFAKRHAKTFMKLAQKASVELRGANQIFWTGRLIIMRENFRAALAWMVDSGDTESALRFTNAQFEFWLRYPDFEEARQWLEKVLALPGAQNSLEPFSKNLNSLAWIYFLLGKHEEARKRAEHALSLARSQPNTITLVVVLINLGLIIFLQDQDVLNSRALIEEARDLSLEIQAEWEHARSHMALAVVLSRQGKYTEAHSSYEKAFNKFQKLGDLNFQCVVKRLMGELEIERNHLAEGIEAFRDSLKIARVVKNNLQIAYNLLWLARAEKQKGNHVRAFLLYLGSKKVSDTIGTWYEENVLELEESQTIVRELLGDEEFNSTLKAAQKM